MYGQCGATALALHPFSERDAQICQYTAELRSTLTCSSVAVCPRTSFYSRHSEDPWRRCSRSRRRTSDSWRGGAEPRLTGRSGTRSSGKESRYMRRVTEMTCLDVLTLDELPAFQKSRRCLWAAAWKLGAPRWGAADPQRQRLYVTSLDLNEGKRRRNAVIKFLEFVLLYGTVLLKVISIAYNYLKECTYNTLIHL